MVKRKEDMDRDIIIKKLNEIETELNNDTSGDDCIRSAKQYVGCAILLLEVVKRRDKQQKYVEEEVRKSANNGLDMKNLTLKARQQGSLMEGIMSFIENEASRGNNHCTINFSRNPHNAQPVMDFLQKCGFSVRFGIEKDLLIVSWR